MRREAIKDETTTLLRHRLGRTFIERKIRFQNVHSRLAQNSELARFRVLAHRFTNCLLAHTALFCDPRHLKLGCLGRDVRIESRARRRQQIHWNRNARVLRLQSLRISLYSCDQRPIRWSQIRTAGVAGIVAGSRA